ncbi:amino acid transporter [Gemmatimonadetes bacterium T265]|nr:amino acid transporter [Gemmatimonadetes bacterium T265]
MGGRDAVAGPVSGPVAGTALRRTLGLGDLVLLAVGTVIGSGIFIVPATVLRQTGGSTRLALAVWVAAGVLSLLGALTYGELGAARPEAGGLYAYVRDAFGPLPAFLYGWTAFFVIASGSVATLAVAFASYAQQFVPLAPGAAKLVAVLMIVAVMLVNVRGARQGADVQNVSTIVKAGAVVLVSLVLLALGRGGASAVAPAGAPPAWPAAFDRPLLSGVGLAMIGVLWAYEGWQYVTFSAGETVDPQRVFPRGIVAGTALVVGVYVLANLAYVAALGPAAAARSERVAADAVGAVLGPAAARVIAAVILVSMFSAANGITLTAPRMYYAMGRDRVFFARLGAVHPRFGTPAFAIVASSAWAAVLAATGTFEQLLTYVVFVGWIFYALGALAIFAYRRREPDLPRPFRTPGYPVTPILFVLSAAAIVVNTVVSQPGRAAVGIGMVLVGVPVFYVWRTRAARAAS